MMHKTSRHCRGITIIAEPLLLSDIRAAPFYQIQIMFNNYNNGTGNLPFCQDDLDKFKALMELHITADGIQRGRQMERDAKGK